MDTPTPVEYDVTHWPLAVLVLPADVNTLDIGRVDRSLAALFARKQRFYTLTDASRVTGLPNAKGRGELAAWTKAVEAQTRRHVVATSIVISNPLARGMLTAIHWVAPAVVPSFAAATHEEACRFLGEHGVREGLETDAIDRYLATRSRR